MKLPTSPPTRCLAAAVWLLVCAGSATEAEEEAVPAKAPRRDFSLYEAGRYVYEQHCVVCHGAQGDGKGEMAPSLPTKPRSFTAGLFKYRSTPWGKLPTNEDLLRTVRSGRTGTAMGMFTFLSEDELRAVVEYVKFFSRTWRKPENYAPPVAVPDAPPWLAEPGELARRAEAGRKTFETVCAACHGPVGDGHGPAAATLKDEWGEAAVPADLRQPHLRSGDEPGDIIRVLLTGLNGTPMVSFAETLTAEQNWEVAAYILALRRDFEKAAPAPGK